MRKNSPSKFRQIVRNHLLEVKWNILFAAFCMLGFTLTELLSPWPLKIIFDHVLLEKTLDSSPWVGAVLRDNKMYSVVVISMAILVIASFRASFSYFQLFITSRLGYQLVYQLRRELFSHLQRLSLSFHHRSRSGELLTKITSDTTTLKDIFVESALNFATHLLTLLGMFGIMFYLNWKLSMIVLATFPVLLYSLFFIYRRVKASARRQREREGKIASRISEVLRSVSIVQAFAREEYEQKRFENESQATLTESIKTARTEAAASRTVEIISAFSVCAVVLFGALQVIDGRMTPGDVLIFTAYLTSMYKPLRQLARLSSQFSKATVSAERISEILETETETPDLPMAIAASRLNGDITFNHVSFSYGENKQVLKDVSFTIPAGQRVALVGASGVGKSTIASLILRFYDPQEGAILIDGLHLKMYQRESLRREIGVVLQDTVLFGVSIRENIAYGKPHATITEVEAAARIAFAHDFIMALRDGYDTVIAERGSTLSGGQRQRICLARAFIKNPSILILDEPTSAVDVESSRLIQKAIEEEQHNKTTIVIAHQFSFIENFDLIMTLKNGAIVERGTHHQLLAARGYYYDLYQLQGMNSTPPAPAAKPEIVWEEMGLYPLPARTYSMPETQVQRHNA